MRRNGKTASALSVFALAFFMNASSAWADFYFTASNGSGLSASVNFSISGGNLIITLTNTSSSDVGVPSQVLTAVFFTLPGSVTPVSAVLSSGSNVFYGSENGGDMGGEWAYKSGLSLNGATAGISSSGFDIFGPGDLFGGDNLQGPVSPDGLQYGLTSAGDNLSSGNAAVTGGFALIQNSVVFTLSGWSSLWDVEDISNVWFQYGTSLSEPNLGVPEPGTWVLMSVGLIGLVFAFRRMSWA